MKRREAILSTIAALTGATAAAPATRPIQVSPLPALPTIPIVADPELAEQIRCHYDWDLAALADVVESAILVFRLRPDWVSSGEMPEQLRRAIFDNTGEEALSQTLGNLKPLQPGYTSKLIEKAKASLERDRTQEKRRAEAEALAAAKEAERVSASAAKCAERAERDRVALELTENRIVSQRELRMVVLTRNLSEITSEPLQKRMREGWTIELGALTVGPGPDFQVIGEIEEDECA